MPPRLAQKLMAGRFTPTNAGSAFGELANPALLARRLREAVLMTADGAADVIAGRGGVELDLRTDFPCLAPPFATFWIEAQVGPGARWGVLFEVEPVSPELDALEPYRGGRWILRGTLFMGAAGQAIGPSSCLLVVVDADGGYLNRTVIESPIRRGHASEEQFYLFALLAISFMHCKNVRATEHELLDAVTPKRERHPIRDKGLRYYTLEIDSVREVLRSEGRSQEVGLKQALHLCRGHFKDYRQSGLFGKVKGLFWWDAHARGTREAGVVVKDYDIKGSRKEDA